MSAQYKGTHIKTVLTAAAFNATSLVGQAKCHINGQEIPCEQALDQAGKFVGAFFGVFALMVGLFILVGIAATVFWIVMLVHAASKPIENRAMWILVIVFTHALGALIYYFAVKREFDRASKVASLPVGGPPSAPSNQ